MSFSIRILCIGKPAALQRETLDHYERLIRPFAKVTTEMISSCTFDDADVTAIRRDEGKRLLARFEKNAYHAALSEEGTGFKGSRDFADWMNKRRQAARPLCLVIGGAYGLSDEAKAGCDRMISLSPLTLPHELCRTVLMEQLYRAFTILNGHPYHK